MLTWSFRARGNTICVDFYLHGASIGHLAFTHAQWPDAQKLLTRLRKKGGQHEENGFNPR